MLRFRAWIGAYDPLFKAGTQNSCEAHLVNQYHKQGRSHVILWQKCSIYFFIAGKK